MVVEAENMCSVLGKERDWHQRGQVEGISLAEVGDVAQEGRMENREAE